MWTPGMPMGACFPQTRPRYARHYAPEAMTASEIFAPGMLEGRVALVTGGGTGLGRAAAALRACGAEVVISGRRREVLDATAAELGLHAVDGDVREPDGAERMVRFALER